MYVRIISLFIFLSSFACVSHADEGTKTPSYEEIQTSVVQIERDWDHARNAFTKKFKDQLDPINQKIEELKNALDNGDMDRRKKINRELEGLKESRDEMRQALHEITATSVVKLSGIQKYFKNAKDDTKD